MHIIVWAEHRVARVNYGGIESLTAWTHKAREQDKGNFLLKAEQLEKLLAQIGYRSPCIKGCRFCYIHTQRPPWKGCNYILSQSHKQCITAQQKLHTPSGIVIKVPLQSWHVCPLRRYYSASERPTGVPNTYTHVLSTHTLTHMHVGCIVQTLSTHTIYLPKLDARLM